MNQTLSEQLNDLTSGVDIACKAMDPADLERAAGMLLNTRRMGRFVFLCGNGGSAGLANHAANDFAKAGLHAISLGQSPELITAAGNDDGYENVFSSQLEMLARTGDMLLTISSSGKSPNIIRALEYASDNGLKSVSLTGFTGGKARERADVSVHVEADVHDYGVVETAHQAILHAFAAHVKARWSASSEAAR